MKGGKTLDDKIIIQHYWDRDERAIRETDEKYGSFCCSIAENILGNREDAGECVNDTYLKTWNAIPPQWPEVFPAFIGKIVRNTAFNRYKSLRTERRGGGLVPVVLDELDECIPDRNAEVECSTNELREAMNSFVGSLSERNRKIFLQRYWCTESVRDIAEKMNMTENSVSAVLKRTRKKLHKYLAERGFVP